MTQQVKAEKASNLRGKERVSGLLIASLAVALALVVMLQAVRPTALSTTNLAPPASDRSAASGAPALPNGAALETLRGVAAIRALDSATGSAGVSSAAHLRNVAAVRVADAAGRGAGAATAYAGLRGVAGVRALDAANSRADAATTPR
jgi:hypothetical protein